MRDPGPEPGQASLRSLSHAPRFLVWVQLDSRGDSLVLLNYVLCLQAGYYPSGHYYRLKERAETVLKHEDPAG